LLPKSKEIGLGGAVCLVVYDALAHRKYQVGENAARGHSVEGLGEISHTEKIRGNS